VGVSASALQRRFELPHRHDRNLARLGAARPGRAARQRVSLRRRLELGSRGHRDGQSLLDGVCGARGDQPRRSVQCDRDVQQRPGWSSKPNQYAPSTGVIFTAPANIGITAEAGDSDGIVNGVRFFANGTQIGASTGPVFSLNWANVPAGSYSVTAVATDNGGGSATSSPLLVTVGIGAESSPSTPTRLAFTASTDHATSVVSYRVELRRASDSATATPVAARDIGKPAPVSGEILTDITTLVDPLSAGSYYAVVVAVGSGGSAASSPSGAFTK
jgi:hypothetical protein